MADATVAQDTLKRAMKDALAETFAEQRDLLREVIAEAFEDVAFAEAIEEGEGTEEVSRERVFDVLEERG